MVKDNQEPANWQQTLAYVIAWIGSVGLLLVDLMFVREVILHILVSIGLLKAVANPADWALARLTYGWTRDIVDYTMMVILGCVGVGLAIVIEYYYRKGIPQGLLTRRIVRVVSIEVIAGALGWVISILFTFILLRSAI